VAANKVYPVELCEGAVRLYRDSDRKPVMEQLAWQLNPLAVGPENRMVNGQADGNRRSAGWCCAAWY
jgi:hypothetical protein